MSDAKSISNRSLRKRILRLCDPVDMEHAMYRYWNDTDIGYSSVRYAGTLFECNHWSVMQKT